MKRWLSILLAAMMVFSMAGVYAYAAEEAEPSVIVETAEQPEDSSEAPVLSTMAAARIWSDVSSISLEVGKKKTIQIYTNLTPDQYHHIHAVKQYDIVTPIEQKWANDAKTWISITLKGVAAGSDVLTFSLEGTSTNGEEVLASVSITIRVTKPGSSEKSTISASDVTMTQSSKKDQSFKLKTKAKGGDKLSFKSSDNSVKVNKEGKVTIMKDYCGRAKITITITSAKGKKKKTKKVTVTVKPRKCGLLFYGANDAMIRYGMKEVPNASGYEVKYTVGSKTRTVRFKKAKQMIGIQSPYGGFPTDTPYKVKARTYKDVDGGRLYSDWSIEETGTTGPNSHGTMS